MSCPICGKDTKPETRPFCSKRCADVDLARWLNRYRGCVEAHGVSVQPIEEIASALRGEEEEAA